ncbi:TetR/AcrR family transcriptional regulator [Kineococcus sp. NBC_00420]|uniref:TetR/AcrR family transcriptional regulator n=1 Tax=Kineococcus sp. NBC_00420 TaxID=2903564 RepID=UPI002E1C17C7
MQAMASHGFRGATLEVIADTAGLARGHVRYIAGNREDLLIEAARYFYFGEAALALTDLAELAAVAPLVPTGSDLSATFDYLFGKFAVPGVENAAVNAFVDAGRTIPAIHDIVSAAYQGLEGSIRAAIVRDRPGVEEAAVVPVVYGVLTIALGNSYLSDVPELGRRQADARAAAEQLVGVLARGAAPTDG